MNKRVGILGLFTPDGVRYRQERYDEIWTLNDWYRTYPELVSPTRIFNPHWDLEGLAERIRHENRYPGDWKQRYLDAAEGGSRIVLVEKLDFLPDDGQELLRDDLPDEVDLNDVVCSITLMIYTALLEGFTEIDLPGVCFGMPDERTHQRRKCLTAIDYAADRGVEVTGTYIDEWRKEFEGPLWDTIEEPQCLSMAHIHAFYNNRISLDTDNLTINTTC